MRAQARHDAFGWRRRRCPRRVAHELLIPQVSHIACGDSRDAGIRIDEQPPVGVDAGRRPGQPVAGGQLDLDGTADRAARIRDGPLETARRGVTAARRGTGGRARRARAGRTTSRLSASVSLAPAIDERRRGVHGELVGVERQVETGPDDDTRDVGQELGEDAADFPVVDEHVVRPLQVGTARRPPSGPSGSSRGRRAAGTIRGCPSEARRRRECAGAAAPRSRATCRPGRPSCDRAARDHGSGSRSRRPRGRASPSESAPVARRTSSSFVEPASGRISRTDASARLRGNSMAQVCCSPTSETSRFCRYSSTARPNHWPVE